MTIFILHHTRVKCLFILIFISPIKGFEQNTLIKIGERCPNVTTNSVINYGRGDLSLSDFSEKVVIIDFWSTWCTSCIASFEKLENLQKKYKREIQILLVTSQEMKTISEFKATSSILKKITLPIITDDKIMAQLFPHDGVPHIVWLDSNKIVRGITTQQYLNDSNVNKIINRVNVNWAVNKKKRNFNYEAPFLLIRDSQETPKDILFTSVSRYIDNVQPKWEIVRDTTEKWLRYYAVNYPILDLYKATFNGRIQFPNRVILDVKDSSRFIYNDEREYLEEWLKKSTYVYELIAPLSISKDQLFDRMRRDLNQFFRLNGRFEMRSMKCFDLVYHKWLDIPKAENDENENVLNYKTIEALIHDLNSQPTIPPIINKTNFANQEIDLNINIPSWTDIKAIKHALQTRGFELIETIKVIEVFVLTDEIDNTHHNNIY